LRLAVARHVNPVRQVLAQQAVGVFVGTALPGDLLGEFRTS